MMSQHEKDTRVAQAQWPSKILSLYLSGTAKYFPLGDQQTRWAAVDEEDSLKFILK